MSNYKSLEVEESRRNPLIDRKDKEEGNFLFHFLKDFFSRIR